MQFLSSFVTFPSFQGRSAIICIKIYQLFLTDCRQLEFKPSHTFDGKRLKKHVIRIEDVIDANFCRTLCYMESSCVSYNLKKTASSDGKYKCELNNATFEGQEDKLKPDSEYMYRGT